MAFEMHFEGPFEPEPALSGRPALGVGGGGRFIEIGGSSAAVGRRGYMSVDSGAPRAPETDEASTLKGAPAQPALPWHGHGTLLVVDDDPPVRAVLQYLFERSGFTVLTAADGRSALDAFRRSANEIRLVLLDLVLPDTDGETLFRAMRQIRPGLPAILCSGYIDDRDADQRRTAGWAAVIRKPFRLDPLLQAVCGALQS